MSVRPAVAGCVLLASLGLQAPAQAAAVSLRPLVALSAERVALADKVAAAKFGTGKPIDDPVRERQVLDQVAARSAGMGLDAAEAVAVFRDQIEANKLVQRALFRRWTAHPEQAPATRPDLEKEVRPALDRITAGLLAELKDTEGLRGGPACRARLNAAVTHTGWALDRLHRAGLVRAVPSVCSARRTATTPPARPAAAAPAPG